MRTLVAIPCMDTVHALFFRSCLAMRYFGEVEFSLAISSLVYDARNNLAAKAVNGSFDRILWLDSDIEFEPDLFAKMHERLDQGLGIVSGLYFSRKEPIQPVVYKKVCMRNKTPIAEPYLDYPNSIFEIAACGFGAVMMDTDIIYKVGEKYGLPFSPKIGYGEDLSFCLRARKLGYKIYCDPTIKLGHIAALPITEWTYREGRNGKTQQA